MLERTDELEACQMPINAFDPNYKSFITNVMPRLIEKGMAPCAMKSLANGGFFGGTSHFNSGDKPRIVPNTMSVEEALYFSWSLPISVLVTGPDHADMLSEKIELAKKFKAFDEKKRQQLISRVSGFDGKLVEYYKV
jgi:uncharacterized protein